MPDLRTLLTEAAPTPRHEIDFDALLRRTTRRRRRRIAALISACGVALGLAIPAGQGVFVTADRSDESSPAPPHTTSTRPTDTAPPVTEPSAPFANASGGTSQPPNGGAADDQATRQVGAAAATSPPTTLLTPSSPTSEPSPSPTAPVGGVRRADACSVDNEGLGAGETRSCEFIATAAGGLRGNTHGSGAPGPEPDRRVTVTRDGATRTYIVRDVGVFAGDEGVSCDNDAVEPGDHVVVQITNPPTGTGAVVRDVGAGVGWYCY